MNYGCLAIPMVGEIFLRVLNAYIPDIKVCKMSILCYYFQHQSHLIPNSNSFSNEQLNEGFALISENILGKTSVIIVLFIYKNKDDR